MVAAFAAYAGASTREFSTAKPLLDLRLPDGSRLSAWMSVSARPGLTIRRHRLADVELADLVPLGTLDAGLVALLTAAVRARKNIVVTGGVNAGKTTLVRALAGAFDPAEKLVVAEKDYELALDALPHRHHQVVSLQARDANAEGAGQVSLADLVTHALRMNPSRIIVGEVRGEELLPMLTAMGSGNDGSLCTLHANSAHAAFNRMAAIGLAGSARLPVEATHLLAADAVDLVVHVALDDAPGTEPRPIRHPGARGDRGRGERPGRLQRDLPARPGRPRGAGHPGRLPGGPGRRRVRPRVLRPRLVGPRPDQRARPPRGGRGCVVTALAALGGAVAVLGVLLVVAGTTGRGLPERRVRRRAARSGPGWAR